MDKDKIESKDKKLSPVKVKKEKKKTPARRKEIRDTTFNPDGDVSRLWTTQTMDINTHG